MDLFFSFFLKMYTFRQSPFLNVNSKGLHSILKLNEIRDQVKFKSALNQSDKGIYHFGFAIAEDNLHYPIYQNKKLFQTDKFG